MISLFLAAGARDRWHSRHISHFALAAMPSTKRKAAESVASEAAPAKTRQTRAGGAKKARGGLLGLAASLNDKKKITGKQKVVLSASHCAVCRTHSEQATLAFAPCVVYGGRRWSQDGVAPARHPWFNCISAILGANLHHSRQHRSCVFN